MVRKSLSWLGLALLAMVALFWTAGHSLGYFGGYMRATMRESVDNLTDQLPNKVHDRKMANDLKSARREIIDRTVQFNLTETQIDQLDKQVETLRASIARRKRLLAEAYPVLDSATQSNLPTVRFANTDFTMNEFQREIDSLLQIQDRETKQLAIKEAGLARLEKTAQNGAHVLAEMRNALESTEQEVAILKSRRDTAQAESAVLDMVSTITAKQENVSVSIMDGVERQKQQVEQLEAANSARRDFVKDESALGTNKLSRTWSRLEALKVYCDEEPKGFGSPTAPLASPSDDRVSFNDRTEN